MTSFADALDRGGVVLDGGLGTLLESRGNDLSSSLWSARLLLENPAEIREAHAEYFRAGADVAITASYQVTYEALARRDIFGAAADAVLRSSVDLAIEARDSTREEAHGRRGGSPPPLAHTARCSPTARSTAATTASPCRN